MSTPSSKRRKISHDDHGSRDSEDSFASFDESGDSLGGNRDDNLDYNDAHEIDGEESYSASSIEGEGDSHDEDENTENAVRQQKRAGGAEKPPKRKMNRHESAFRSQDGLQGTAYTAEVYKSNVFKLQVDDLLEHIRPRFGKKQGAIDRLLRTLKAIIEEIPDRQPANARLLESLQLILR
jgi:U3 small nucleolar RNA-associated protein 22